MTTERPQTRLSAAGASARCRQRHIGLQREIGIVPMVDHQPRAKRHERSATLLDAGPPFISQPVTRPASRSPATRRIAVKGEHLPMQRARPIAAGQSVCAATDRERPIDAGDALPRRPCWRSSALALTTAARKLIDFPAGGKPAIACSTPARPLRQHRRWPAARRQHDRGNRCTSRSLSRARHGVNADWWCRCRRVQPPGEQQRRTPGDTCL